MLQTAKIFQDGMILQREKPVTVWGTGVPGEKVHVEIQEKSAGTTIDDSGKWELRLPPLEASAEETLAIKSEKESITFHQVAVGEVWLAGGQSNMEFYMRYEKHIEEAKPMCENPRVRFFDVPEAAFDGQLEDFDYSRMGVWRKATQEDIEYFSAVGYYFQKDIEKVLDVPVGIVGCNWGGTTSSAWMSPETVEKVGKPWMDAYREQTADMDMESYWKKQHTDVMNDKGNPFEDAFTEFFSPKTRTQEEIGQFFSAIADETGELMNELQAKDVPGCLYEHMLKTIAPFTVRGVLWYQGESDDVPGRQELYAAMLTGLIADWRTLLKDETLPFLVVQLPGWESWLDLVNIDYAQIRRCQQEVSETVDHVFLCSISDVGERYDIHPKDKKTVGERLALLARGHIYGEGILCDAPKAKSITRRDGQIRIAFENADGGLEIKGEKLRALMVQQNGSPVDYKAYVDGEELVLKAEVKPDAKLQVMFAQDKWYQVNLYNKASVPAVPFVLFIR